MKIEIPARCDVSSLSAFIALSQVSRVPLMIWGHPGFGKTSIVRQYAEETGQHCEVIIGSLYEPPDIAGNVYLEPSDKYGRIQRHSVPEWLVRVLEADEKGQPSIVFFDEISTCMLETQATMLRIVNERMVAGFKIPDSVTFVAASNFPDSSAGFYMTPALANRFMHIHVDRSTGRDEILKDPYTRSFWNLYVSGWTPPPMMHTTPVSEIYPSIVFRTPRTEAFYRRVRAAAKAAGIDDGWFLSTIKRMTIGSDLLGDESVFEMLLDYIEDSFKNKYNKRISTDVIKQKIDDVVKSGYIDVYVPIEWTRSSDKVVALAAALCNRPHDVTKSTIATQVVFENLTLVKEIARSWLEEFSRSAVNRLVVSSEEILKMLYSGDEDGNQ